MKNAKQQILQILATKSGGIVNQIREMDLLYRLLAFCTKLDAKNEKCITNCLYPRM